MFNERARYWLFNKNFSRTRGRDDKKFENLINLNVTVTVGVVSALESPAIEDGAKYACLKKGAVNKY